MSSLVLVLVFISGVNGQQDKVNINYNVSVKGKLKFIGFVLNKMQTYVCSILKIPNTINQSRHPTLIFAQSRHPDLNFRTFPSSGCLFLADIPRIILIPNLPHYALESRIPAFK